MSDVFAYKLCMPLIAPSILASDWGKLDEEIKAISAAGADLIHCDVMDGTFVPPITFGADFVRAVGKATKIPLDVHLMIHAPEKHAESFARAGATYLTVHQEACPHLHRVVQHIRELGMKPGVALNPATPVSTLKNIVGDIDLLLVMTVNPGWGGQKFIEQSIGKIEEAAQLIKSSGRDVILEVDGGINAETAKRCVKAGARALVSGSYLFQQKGSYQQAIASLR